MKCDFLNCCKLILTNTFPEPQEPVNPSQGNQETERLISSTPKKQTTSSNHDVTDSTEDEGYKSLKILFLDKLHSMSDSEAAIARPKYSAILKEYKNNPKKYEL